jgi:hypothetical protein
MAMDDDMSSEKATINDEVDGLEKVTIIDEGVDGVKNGRVNYEGVDGVNIIGADEKVQRSCGTSRTLWLTVLVSSCNGFAFSLIFSCGY